MNSDWQEVKPESSMSSSDISDKSDLSSKQSSLSSSDVSGTSHIASKQSDLSSSDFSGTSDVSDKSSGKLDVGGVSDWSSGKNDLSSDSSGKQEIQSSAQPQGIHKKRHYNKHVKPSHVKSDTSSVKTDISGGLSAIPGSTKEDDIERAKNVDLEAGKTEVPVPAAKSSSGKRRRMRSRKGKKASQEANQSISDTTQGKVDQEGKDLTKTGEERDIAPISREEKQMYEKSEIYEKGEKFGKSTQVPDEGRAPDKRLEKEDIGNKPNTQPLPSKQLSFSEGQSERREKVDLASDAKEDKTMPVESSVTEKQAPHEPNAASTTLFAPKMDPMISEGQNNEIGSSQIIAGSTD